MPSDALAYAFTALGALVPFTIALYVFSLEGDRLALRLFGATLCVAAIAPLSALENVVELQVAWPAVWRGWDFWYLYQQVIGDLGAFLFILFCATYPRPAQRGERIAFVVLAAVPVLCFAGYMTPALGDTVRAYFLDTYAPVLRYAVIAALLLAAWRARDRTEERGANLTLVSFQGYALVNFGAVALQLLLLPLGIHYQAEARVHPGWSLADTGDVARNLVEGAIPIGALAAYFVWRRSWLAIGLIGLGAMSLVVYQFGAHVFAIGPLVALVPAYAIQRYGAFHAARARPRSEWLLAAAAGIAVFATIVLSVNQMFPEEPTLLTLGVLAGIVVGGVVAFQLRPHGAATSITLDLSRRMSVTATTPREGDVLRPGALALGRYRVDRLLGQGGQGRAYLARDTRLGRDVVLKAIPTPDETSAARAMREARVLGALEHPHVVRLYDAEPLGAFTVLILEYVEAGSLASRLRRGPVPRAEADRIAAQLLDGLATAHAAGIVHGDVKPENVLLARDGSAKLVDFGIARETRPGATVVAGGGTAAYMSPEQMRGEQATPASDVFAAGLVYYELLAGRPARAPGLDVIQAQAVALDERVDEPRADALLARALARAAAQRPSASELRDELRAR